MVSVKIPAYSSESSYAANPEMATNEYNQATVLSLKKRVTRLFARSWSIDCSATNVPEEQTIKTLFYMADGELVAALLVGNDQLQKSN